MYSKWIKSGFILAVLLVSTVSLSMAACPWFIKNELYSAQCGVLKDVPASMGLLANDRGATAVLDPASITIDPAYGTLVVQASGAFVYNPNPDMKSGTYVTFKYNATNGACAAKYAGTAKIQVSCKCRPIVKDITLCLTPTTTLDEIKQNLIEAGVDCIGCGAAPTVLDLSSIKLTPGRYRYLLKCPGCQDAVGWVTLVSGCTAQAPPLEFCAGSVRMSDLPGMIQAACAGVGCGLPVIDYGNVTEENGFVSGGYYVAICSPGTECGSWASGDISVIQKCTVTAPDLTICEGKTLAEVEALIAASCALECDEGPELDLSAVAVDADEFVTGGSYTACCYTVGTTGVRCESCASGTITVVPGCEVEVIDVNTVCMTPEEMEALIIDSNSFSCGDCDIAPTFDFPDWPLNADGKIVGNDESNPYHFTVTCHAGPDGCDSQGTGEVITNCQVPCTCVATAEPIEVCLGEVKIPALKAMILNGGYTECIDASGTGLCDNTPTIDTSGVTVDANEFVTGGSYKAICQLTDNCEAFEATGTVTAIPCCKCDAVAPTIEVCPETTIAQLVDMIDDVAACDDLNNANCDATPQIDTSGVTQSNGYVTGGSYKVTCLSNTPDCTNVATGRVTVVDSPECHPCNCEATAPEVCFQIVCLNDDCHIYTYDEVLAKVIKEGGSCAASCSEMTLKFYDSYGREIEISDINWNSESTYKYEVVCEKSDGTCTAQSQKSDLKVKYDCGCGVCGC